MCVFVFARVCVFVYFVYVARFLKGTCDKTDEECLLSHVIVKGKVNVMT